MISSSKHVQEHGQIQKWTSIFTNILPFTLHTHETITQTGITCNKISCYMRDSACRWLIVENTKIFQSYAKHFKIFLQQIIYLYMIYLHYKETKLFYLHCCCKIKSDQKYFFKLIRKSWKPQKVIIAVWKLFN